MAVKLTRKMPFGQGIKGYQFDVHEDPEHDRQVYDGGLELERSLVKEEEVQGEKKTSKPRLPKSDEPL